MFKNVYVEFRNSQHTDSPYKDLNKGTRCRGRPRHTWAEQVYKHAVAAWGAAELPDTATRDERAWQQ